MRKILFILLLISFNCQAQKRVDTVLNVTSDKSEHWTLNITSDRNQDNGSHLLLYYLTDSAGKAVDSKLILLDPKGRTSKKVLLDSLKAIKLRYNLTLN